MCSLWNFYSTHSNIYKYIYIYIYIYVVLPATYKLTYVDILIYIYSLMQNHFSTNKKKKNAMQNYFLTYVEIYILTYIYI
jgi:hypothetical protein